MRSHHLAFVASLSLSAAGCLRDEQGLGSMTSSTSTTSTSTSTSSSTLSTGSGGSGQGGSGQGGSGQGGSGQGGSGGAASALAYARFGHRNGQETLGDFCVAYAQDSNGGYVWENQGILAANQVDPNAYTGLERLTSYLPLTGKPVAFGFAYPGAPCANAHGWWSASGQPAIPSGFDYFTVLAVPHPGEVMQVWAVGDPVQANEGPQAVAGLRVVNAISYLSAIDVSVETPPMPSLPIGQFDFANSPTDYIDIGSDHLQILNVTEAGQVPIAVKYDFTEIDLLALTPRKTIYLASGFGRPALACTDTTATLPGDPKSAYCRVIEGQVP